ncbi:MAG TPA: CBASS cGAMP-activated phospholipase [Roseiflexaceae bacterium]|nr:CBASS cGAMP-activated phospholipase [Roseiflexaceae bacterium]
MPKFVKILSIDGGGIRGIIPAMILAEIERRTKKPIASMFDLIAGTSTGGLIALGVTKPGARGKPQYSAQQIVQMYEDDGATIFSRSIWHRVIAVGNFLEEKYASGGIEQVLEKYFGNAMLNEVLTDVLISSYEIEQRFPFFFKSSKAKRMPNYDFPMKKVARATSAAPTYFEPLKLEAQEPPGYYALVDGGVYANNPAMCAYVEAVSQQTEPCDYLVLSLGTGELTRPIRYDDAKDWGLAMWAQPILNVVFDGVSDTVDYQLQQIFPAAEDGTRHYYRYQVTLNMGNDDMDDASQTNLFALKALAKREISKNSAEIDRLCAQLTAGAR